MSPQAGGDGGTGAGGGRPASRSALASGYLWASRATALGLEFALPTWLWFVLDRRWQTAPALAIVGATLGFIAGMVHVLRLSKDAAEPSGRDEARRGGPGHPPT